MARPALKGFSLAETVMVVSLTALLLLLGQQLLIPSLRLQRKENSLAQAQQRLILALGQIREILQSSGAGGIFLDGPYLSCQPVREVLSNAEIAWEIRPRLVVFSKPRRELRRIDWTDSPTSPTGWSSQAPLLLTAGDLTQLSNDGQGHSRLLANEIDVFRVTHEAGPGLKVGREIDLLAETWAGDRHTHWQMHLSLRNSW